MPYTPPRRPRRRISPQRPLTIRIRPGTLSGVYAAVSRDVSRGAPSASRIETRPANETDFGPEGPLPPEAEVEMPQWHRGVTN